MQGEGIRVTGAATPGGTITIQVASADGYVELGVLGSNKSERFNVPANQDTPIPIPQVAPGTLLVLRVGKGLRRRRILITVLST